MHSASSWLLAPLRKPPPGASMEAMFSMPTLALRLLKSSFCVCESCNSSRATESVSTTRSLISGSDPSLFAATAGKALPLGDVGGTSWAGGCTTSSAASMPRFARGCVVSKAGITLLMVTLAFFARTFFLNAAGGCPTDGTSRPIFECVYRKETLVKMILKDSECCVRVRIA